MAGFNGRQKRVSSGGGGVHRRGSGLGTGPVGHNQGGASGLGSGSGSGSDRNMSNGGFRSSGSGCLGALGIFSLFKKNKVLGIIVLVVLIFFLVKSGACDGLFGGIDTDDYDLPTSAPVINDTTSYSTGSGLSDILGSVFGNGSQEAGYTTGSYSTGWTAANNSGKLNTEVVTGTPAKRTAIYGGGNDQITVMLYMCGTDLESQGGAATADIQEILNSKLSDNINIIIYTGGCSRWQNNVVSSKYNQIYRIFNANGKTSMECLNDNCGNAAMTNPDTLSGFIKFCKANYPANRQMLIFWDHGGGSISGYGYDEKYSGSGSMTIEKIGKALKSGGASFDFIGFDACLMATVETATMLTDYADYMIASEEVEPGCGWYYTNWLTNLAKDPGMSTLQIGKNIADDFVNYSLKSMNGYDSGLTLSIVDLAEFEYTVPDRFAAFAAAASDLIGDGGSSSGYKTVANAASGAKEFGATSKIDQRDLVGFASGIDTTQSEQLSKAILSAVKYNITSKAMQNAYGLSVFFPTSKRSYVSTATAIYDEIGLSEKYTECITKFAGMQTSGAIANGGSGLSSLLGGLSGLSGSDYSSSYGSTYGQSSSDISSLLGSVWGGSDYSSYSSASGIESLLGGIGGDSTGILGSLFSGRSLSTDGVAQYISMNQFDPSNLVWKTDSKGTPRISLSKDQWGLVSDLALVMFYDDGEGYIDLGRDNIFTYDETDGSLIGETDNTWLAIDGQNICYYYESCTAEGESYVIKGWVPCLINGVRAEMDIIFSNENPYGIITGARYIYENGETDTVAKSATFVEGGKEIDLTKPGNDAVNYTGLKEGDKIDFIADYYRYDGTYEDTYMIGEQWIYHENYEIANVDLGLKGAKAMYVFTDIYNSEYWTEPMP